MGVKKILPLIFIGLAFWSCEDADTTPPTVTITSPQNNASVYEMVTITCMSSDNEGVEKVELWVDGVSIEIIGVCIVVLEDMVGIENQH